MSCVACGSTGLTKTFTATDINNGSFDFLICGHCNTLQIAEFNSELLSYAYHAGYYGGSDTKFKWPFSTLFDWEKYMAAKNAARLINNKQAHILDIGCGKGDFLDKLHKFGYVHLWGNDIEKPKNLPDHINWLSGTFTKSDLTDERFDLITLTHVFEHLPEPRAVIQKLYALLNPDGLILLSQPNISGRQAKKYKNMWFHLDPPRHLHLMPPIQLKKMFVDAGFQPVSEKYDSPLYNSFGYLQSWLNKRISQRDLLYEFLKKGGRIRGFRHFAQLLFSFLYAGLSLPFYFLIDKSKGKKGESGTMEFVFRKL